MSTINTFKDLAVWQKGMDLSVEVHRLVKQFPAHERFDLCIQLTRSVNSIPSNIAEGYGRGSYLEYARFVRIARGSLNELETQVELAFRLGYLDNELFENLLGECKHIRIMLSALNKALLAGVLKK